MPGRSSSSSRSSSKPSYSYSSPKSPVPAPTHTSTQTPSVIQHNHQVQQPGFFSNMLQGFGLGAGQSIAMNIFRSDPVVKHTYENVSPTTSLESKLPKEFVQCMKENNNDKDLCKQYLE